MESCRRASIEAPEPLLGGRQQQASWRDSLHQDGQLVHLYLVCEHPLSCQAHFWGAFPFRFPEDCLLCRPVKQNGAGSTFEREVPLCLPPRRMTSCGGGNMTLILIPYTRSKYLHITSDNSGDRGQLTPSPPIPQGMHSW